MHEQSELLEGRAQRAKLDSAVSERRDKWPGFAWLLAACQLSVVGSATLRAQRHPPDRCYVYINKGYYLLKGRCKLGLVS